MLIEVHVPTLLRDSVGGQAHFSLEADTLTAALRRMSERYPNLHTHLYQEDGKLRPHVLIFYNDESISWLKDLDIALKQGDELQIVQSVSGG